MGGLKESLIEFPMEVPLEYLMEGCMEGPSECSLVELLGRSHGESHDGYVIFAGPKKHQHKSQLNVT